MGISMPVLKLGDFHCV